MNVEPEVEDLWKELKETVFKHALLNAYKHGGKASLKHVVSKIVAEEPQARRHIKSLIPLIQEIVEEVNKMSIDRQEDYLKKNYPELLEEKRDEGEKGLPPLPGGEEGKVRTRFAPNPDFVIHLGNSRVAILSHYYARMYKGIFVLRFEDTDPRTKTPLPDAYHLIKEDLKWLGIDWDLEVIQSLRMDTYYEIARELIEKGGAYVDRLPKEEFSKLLLSGKPHPQRDAPSEHNLEEFDKMISGQYGEGEAVLRVKTDWHHKDKSVVDWVAFRVIDTDKHPHPLTGSRYAVWPTYNFAAGVDDHLLGITHIIRGKEHAQNTVKQLFLYQHMGWRYPTTINVGRLKLENLIMSKSHIREILSKATAGSYTFDDPRFATLAGLRRRGIHPDAIKAIMVDIGVKRNDVRISYANLAAVNRKLVDSIAPRLSFVPEPVVLEVDDNSGGECLEAVIPYHPDHSDMGSRKWRVCQGDQILISRDDYQRSLGKEVRLMELGNYEVTDGKLVLKSIELEYARKKRLSIIQWLPEKEAVDALLLVPRDEEFATILGKVEKSAVQGIDGDFVQFFRIGFARIERRYPIVEAIFSHE